MESNKKGLKQHRGSDGILHVIVIVCIALAVFGGFLAGLLLLRGRIVKSEEVVQRMSSICRQDEATNPNSYTGQRARRDTTPITFEVVRGVIQAQLRSVTASRVCAVSDELCVQGPDGLQGRNGCEGQMGQKGITGERGSRPPYSIYELKGEPGEQGMLGRRGDYGDTGPRGVKGIKGQDGDPGSSARGEEQNGEAPTVYATPAILTVKENASATFACFAFGEPPPHIFWGKEGKGGVNSCFGKLTFERARLQDSGTYTCNVFNRHGNAQASIELRVQGKNLKSVIHEKMIEVKAYQDVRLACHADAKAAWTVDWSKADQSDLPEGRTKIRNAILVIKQIHVNDTAVYICRAQTSQGLVETRIKVTVNPRTGQTRSDAVRNCKELKEQVPSISSGTYWIDLDLGSPDNAFQTYCDQETDGGGWTLVWSYEFSYGRWGYWRKRFTPRPSFPTMSRSGQLSLSRIAPLNESYRGALDFSLWQVVGSEVLLKSNLINWFVCTEGEGSILKWKAGHIRCSLVKTLLARCSAIPSRLTTHAYGLTLDTGTSRGVIYNIVVTPWPGFRHRGSILDACARGKLTANHNKKGAENPQGSWYVR